MRSRKKNKDEGGGGGKEREKTDARWGNILAKLECCEEDTGGGGGGQEGEGEEGKWRREIRRRMSLEIIEQE